MNTRLIFPLLSTGTLRYESYEREQVVMSPKDEPVDMIQTCARASARVCLVKQYPIHSRLD